MDYKFVDSEQELAQSTIEFFDKPEFWRASLGSAPKYFVHIQMAKNIVSGFQSFVHSKTLL